MPGELALAFAAGIVSFISPCCLPMVPMYLSYLAGIAGGTARPPVPMPEGAARSFARAAPERWLVVFHALWFVGGFALVFVALGASASVMGQLLRSHLLLVRHAAGVIIALLGLHTAGLLRLAWLYREWRPQVRPYGEGGLLRSALLGLAFGAGWTPCVGPMLGSILLLGATSSTLGQGVLLLLAYALGLGLPFLVAAAALGGLAGVLRQVNRYLGVVSWLSGALLVAMGVMVYEGTFVQLARLFPVGL